ncbi:MAG: hypothetical protein GKR89_21450 [Candidatus Latescibacteria bacterium]|nr:hypothetical protein [Candidatus Latescibacterota bacterium]
MPSLSSLMPFVRYNAGHVFAGKAVYFFLLAVLVFFISVLIHALDVEVPPEPRDIYFFLLAPGLLLVFYPSAYAVQADTDARMLETLFGIPDYRYKIWLVRHVVQQGIVALVLTLLALFCQYALTDFPLWRMVFHLFFPIFFLSSLAFALACLTRSGNGAAVVLVIVGLLLLILAEPLENSAWNLFHNPFVATDQLGLRQETTFYNRAYLLVGAVLATLLGLLRLQQREKFV